MRFGTVREWRAIACGAFGHGMSKIPHGFAEPCPYWGKSESKGTRFSVAQAIVPVPQVDICAMSGNKETTERVL